MTLEVLCTAEFADLAEEKVDNPADPNAVDAGETVWARAWNKQMYGSVVQYDAAEQAATGGAAAATGGTGRTRLKIWVRSQGCVPGT